MQLLTNNKIAQDKTDTPNDNWINLPCNATGSKDATARPPADAVAAVRAPLIETTRMLSADADVVHRKRVDAHVLEAWRVAAMDPDDQIFLWLRDGGPTGITSELRDPGKFPEV